MRTEVIEANTIDKAVRRILEELKEDDDGDAATSGSTTTSSRHNVIYFDGWDGLGASAVLREIGQHLTTGEEFSQIIHIDCSKWESRRVTQRALAEQLQLPTPVMQMFDAQDEEDDYNGVVQGSRVEIPKVAREIYQHVQKDLSHRFLVIFINGSREEIDLESFGFPLSGYSRNKLLWSFQGRFRLYPRMEVNKVLESTRTTDVVLSAASSKLNEYNFSDILSQEAEELVAGSKINIGSIDWPAAAANCFLYMMRLCGMGDHYDLGTHICNYWRCDGVIQLQTGKADTDDGAADTLWLSCDALNHEMQLDADYHQRLPSPSPVARRLHEHIACWASPTYGSMLIPPDQYGRIPNGMFQQYDKLSVLKLSACRFSSRSPPFLCCHSLRFLWLDHCQDDERSTDGIGYKDIQRCFQRLWVLDVRYSSSTFLSAKMLNFMTQLRELHAMGQDIDFMDALHGPLRNIRKLRVMDCRAVGRRDTTVLFSGKDRMEPLHLSGISGALMHLYVESSCSSLQTVIIDGSTSIVMISLKGCATLKDLLLSGWFPQLSTLDISGTAVKTLVLSEVVAPKLDELLLRDCVKLCAILWPPQDKWKRYLCKLSIETTQKEASTTITDAAAKLLVIPPGAKLSEIPPTGLFNWYISVRDARLLGSLVPVKDYFGPNAVAVEITTTTTTTKPTTTLSSSSSTLLRANAAGGNRITRSAGQQRVQGNLQQLKDNAIYYPDVSAALKDTGMLHQQSDEGDDDEWSIIWPCPAPSQLPYQNCYTHIEDQMTRAKFQSVAVPGIMCDYAKILHVHNCMSITSIDPSPLGSSWNGLEWCRVERCPKLEGVFFVRPQSDEGPERSSSSMEIFNKLRTIWVSHLPNARHVLEYPRKGPMYRALTNLTLLHLYCCPRLVYAIPLPLSMMSWESLETLEIMWCGDLRWVMEEYTDMSRYIFIGFPRLKHIHLHELPMLQAILNTPAGLPIFTPNLETVKIRGCWSLRKMPFNVGEMNGLVECDCEKEWWNMLKWPSREHSSKSYYKPIHPPYYKKTMLRGAFLR